jgi:hypothetical protein
MKIIIVFIEIKAIIKSKIYIFTVITIITLVIGTTMASLKYDGNSNSSFNIKIYININNFCVYLRAYRAAQRPFIK